MLAQALDSAQAFGQGEDPACAEEALGRLQVAIDTERDHAAEARALLLGNRVVGVVGEACQGWMDGVCLNCMAVGNDLCVYIQ